MIYVNDLPFALDRTRATLYVNDTSISYSSRSVTDFTHDDGDGIRLLLEGNKLSLNVAKNQSMILGSGVRLRSLGRMIRTFKSFRKGQPLKVMENISVYKLIPN